MACVTDVVIIGAGIGGLSLAALLQQAGIRATVFEQATELKEVGAGLGLWSNAVRVLLRMGMDQSMLRVCGQPMVHSEVNNRFGRCLSSMNMKTLLAAAGIEAQGYILHRADLHNLLAGRVDAASIQLGARCERIDWKADGATVHFAGRESVHARLVVGADGLHSVVRAALWGEVKPDYGGEVIFRGIAKGFAMPLDQFREVHGSGRRVGIYPLDSQRTYWWATDSLAEGAEVPIAQRQAHLLEAFAGWPYRIAELLRLTPPESILMQGIYDRPPLVTWHRGAVTLLGDAAHPTTPNMGQGACMAIEDAAYLTDALVRCADREKALTAYERIRIPRTTKIVKMSRFLGTVGQWHSPLACMIRDTMIRAMPEQLMGRFMLEQVNHQDVLAE